jgi:hypothetical protein
MPWASFASTPTESSTVSVSVTPWFIVMAFLESVPGDFLGEVRAPATLQGDVKVAWAERETSVFLQCCWSARAIASPTRIREAALADKTHHFKLPALL